MGWMTAQNNGYAALWSLAGYDGYYTFCPHSSLVSMMNPQSPTAPTYAAFHNNIGE
jgi:hypothetical protein